LSTVLRSAVLLGSAICLFFHCYQHRLRNASLCGLGIFGRLRWVPLLRLNRRLSKLEGRMPFSEPPKLPCSMLLGSIHLSFLSVSGKKHK